MFTFSPFISIGGVQAESLKAPLELDTNPFGSRCIHDRMTSFQDAVLFCAPGLTEPSCSDISVSHRMKRSSSHINTLAVGQREYEHVCLPSGSSLYYCTSAVLVTTELALRQADIKHDKLQRKFVCFTVDFS